MRAIVRVGVVLAGVAITFAACGGSSTTPGLSTAPSSDKDPWRKEALWIVEGDKTRPFDNGSTVAVGDLDVGIFLAPYPPLMEGSIDLFITERASGAAVKEDEVDVSFILDMHMSHRPVRGEAVPMGDGHFLLTYKLVMPGEWRVDITVNRGSHSAPLSLGFRVS